MRAKRDFMTPGYNGRLIKEGQEVNQRVYDSLVKAKIPDEMIGNLIEMPKVEKPKKAPVKKETKTEE